MGSVSSNGNVNFSNEYVFNRAVTSSISVGVLSSDRFVVAYSDDDAGFGAVVVGSVDNNGLVSFGSARIFTTESTYCTSVGVLNHSRFIVAYSYYNSAFQNQPDWANRVKCAVTVCSVSGSNIRFMGILDSKYIGPVNFYNPDIAHVTDNIYVVVDVYKEISSSYIVIRTIDISSSVVTNHFIDSYIISNINNNIIINVHQPRIIKIRATDPSNYYYLILFDDCTVPFVYAFTISINGTGSINKEIIDASSWIYDQTNPERMGGVSVDVISVDTKHQESQGYELFAVTYASKEALIQKQKIRLIKVYIDGEQVGSIDDDFTGEAVVDEDNVGYYSTIEPVPNEEGYYLVGYSYIHGSQSVYHPVVRLVRYDTSTESITSIGDPFLLSDRTGSIEDIHVVYAYGSSSYIYFIVSYVSGEEGYLETIKIEKNNNLGISRCDGIKYGSSISGSYPYIFSDNILILAHGDRLSPSSNPYIGSFRVGLNGEINQISNGDLTFSLFDSYIQADSTDGTNFRLYPLSGGGDDREFIVLYQGRYKNGYIELIRIQPGHPVQPVIERRGSYKIWVETDANDNMMLHASVIDNNNTEWSLSVDLYENDWNFFVLNYSRGYFISLYNRGKNQGGISNNIIYDTRIGSIFLSNKKLFFGGFPGNYDVFVIYNTVLTPDDIDYHFNHPGGEEHK